MRPAAALLCLLLLAACGGTSAPNNTASPADPAPSTMSPPPSQGPTQAPTMADPGDAAGPENRFIVCPGNPRCPPEGSQPKNR